MAKGRKTKLTPEIHKRITDIIQAGNYAKIAAFAAGINPDTYYEWLNRGKSDAAKGKTTIFSDFSDAVTRAEAIAEAANVTLIRTAAQNGTWQAAGWFLERKHSDRWGRNDKLRQEITGKNGDALPVMDAKAIVRELLDQRHDSLNNNNADNPENGE